LLKGGIHMDEKVLEKIREEAERVVERHGLEVFDLTFRRETRGWVLRLTIDNPVGYVSIKDCEIVSRELERWLDEVDLIDKRYVLEVSSPGLDRPLRGEKDYIRFQGKLAKFVMKDGTTIVGRIGQFNEGILTVKEGKKEKSIKIEDIKRANLKPEF